MPAASSTHLVLIPSYNPGPKVLDTVRAARAQWTPVWVVIDGSTDGSTEQLQALAASDDGLQVIVLPENRGKGAAVLEGVSLAAAAGFTHALTMDSDGQHPADLIPAFMAASQAEPARMVLGKSGNPVDGHRRFALWLPRLSDCATDPHHARQPLHAALRFRPGSGRPSVLGRCLAAQHRCAGTLPVGGRRRRV